MASTRPLADGPTFFIDGKAGDDAGAGTKDAPWKTIARGLRNLRPGDTLCLRGGVYHEHVVLGDSGRPDAPITVRAAPGELVVVDGGLPEFLASPATAWEPAPGGAAGEFRSVKSYPTEGHTKEGVNLLGLFADSLIPLHGYRFAGDFRTDNPWWNVESKVGGNDAVWCGPGLWQDLETGRIHVRLQHTKLPGLHDDNYRGETDPRKLPLVVAMRSAGPALLLRDARHVRVQDLVVRGAADDTLRCVDCADVELDGLTIYGGASCVELIDTWGVRIAHTACRGLSAPWTFRGSLKYRAIESRLLTTGSWMPSGADTRHVEIAYSEFTDSVDGVFVGNVDGLRFHHNLVDNISDDGVFLTANTAYDGTTRKQQQHFTKNRFSRCLTTFAFGVGHGRQKTIPAPQPRVAKADDGVTADTGKNAKPKEVDPLDALEGSAATAKGTAAAKNAAAKTTGKAAKPIEHKQTGTWTLIAQNVFDFRRPVHYQWPTGPDAPQEITFLGRFAGDHGSPSWEPMMIVHNTFLAGDPPRYEYGTSGFTGGLGHGGKRRIFNNIVCQLHGMPGETLPEPGTNYSCGGNLFWSVSDGVTKADAFLKEFRGSDAFKASQTRHPAGWTTGDKFADPIFESFDADWRKPVDLRLRKGSPAIDAAVVAQGISFDLVGEDHQIDDDGARHIGAIPFGATPWRVGVRGRLDVCGRPIDADAHDAGATPKILWQTPRLAESQLPPPRIKKALVIQGYPAFDAPLIEFALRKANFHVESTERRWVPVKDYRKYDVVAIDGSFARAGIEPTAYRADDLEELHRFLANGGTLVLMRERASELFRSEPGKAFLTQLVGTSTKGKTSEIGVLKPDDAWVKHLTGEPRAWMNAAGTSPLRLGTTKVVENLLGTSDGASLLCRVKVGEGELVLIGWSPAASIPHGRAASTVDQETAFEQQMRILTALVETAANRPAAK